MNSNFSSTQCTEPEPALEQQLSKKPQTHSSFQQIPSDLLPTILSYVSTPHLQYRLVSKTWDDSMKIAHHLGLCHECEVRSWSHDQLLTRMQRFTRQTDGQQKGTPWPLNWKLHFKADLDPIQNHLIPYLDSLKSTRCYSITLDINLGNTAAIKVAHWCLENSKSTKYNFFLSIRLICNDYDQKLVLSILRAPVMKHMTRCVLSGFSFQSEQRYPLSIFRDSHTVSNLKSLAISNYDLRLDDAVCLARSPYLTSLTHLSLDNLQGLNGRTFSDIICSPIMKRVKTLDMKWWHLPLLEPFAQSRYLKSVTKLQLASFDGPEELCLEPFLRCDTTMPSLTSLELRFNSCPPISAMRVVASAVSGLFNRIEFLDLSYWKIPIESMKALCTGGGLQALKTLSFNDADLSDEHVQLLLSASLPQFGNLQHLDFLHNEEITTKSYLALYLSKNLPSLLSVCFCSCQEVTPDFMMKMSELPPRAGLRFLNFSGTENFDAYSSALAALKKVAPQLEVFPL